MNTTRTRVVVTLLLAVASLATMGFRAPFEDSRMASIMPDHATCQAIEPALSSIELLEFVDDHCFLGLIDQVEAEIDVSFSGTGPSTLLLDWFNAETRPSFGGSVEYLAIVEMDTDLSGNPSVSRSTTPAESSVALSGPSAAEVPLDSVYTNAWASDVLNRPEDEPRSGFSARVGFGGPSASDVPLSSVYTNAQPSDVFNRPQDEPSAGFGVRVGFGGPSASDVPLESVYTNAQPSDVFNRPQDEPRAGWRVGFSGPSASDVPLDSVYTNTQP